jgi:HlyD family secretion protein
MKRVLVPLLILTLLLVGCDGKIGVGDEKKPLPETTEGEVEASPEADAFASRIVLADGRLVAVNPALALSFETSGRLLTLTVQPGDRVEPGDVIATLDDGALQDAVTNAELQVAQAETGLAQAQLSLDALLAWEPDETAVALAEANLAAAETSLENAQASDGVAGNSLTSPRIAVEQAERRLADAQEFYDNVFDEARDWEQYISEPICLEGQGGMVPCTGPYWSTRIKQERESAPRNLEAAQENLEIARAQYNLALAGLNNDTAVSANASLVSAQQSLEQATTGPTESEIDAARLQVEQAEISLEQSRFSLQQAQDALAKAELVAPASGTVVSIDAGSGATVAAGTPVVTLLDTDRLEFHTTNLSERDLAQILPGQTAEVTLKAYPTEPFEAQVVRIGLQAGAAVSDAATFPVVLVLGETDLDLRPGMTGRVEIRGGEQSSD